MLFELNSLLISAIADFLVTLPASVTQRLIKKLPERSVRTLPENSSEVNSFNQILSLSPKRETMQTMQECLFCKIIAGQIPSEKILETTTYVAFRDIHPKAPTHILIVPKRHVERPEELRAEEIAEMLVGSEEIAQITGVKESGYRLIFNVGKHAGQEIEHVHLHLIGGRQTTAMY